jgi:hypothetical protein
MTCRFELRPFDKSSETGAELQDLDADGHAGRPPQHAMNAYAHSRGTTMRKLKSQMQIAADGYVAGLQGQLDWMTLT